MTVTVIAWIVEGTWPACVDAAAAHAPEGADIVLLHVTDPDVPTTTISVAFSISS